MDQTTPRGWYPTDVELPDGGRVHIRPLGPDDEAMVAAGFDQLSAESRRTRFFSAMPRLSPALLHWMTDVDQHDHVALVAVRSDDPRFGLGVARAIRSQTAPNEAEVAVTVIDAQQHRGVGSALLRSLRRAALGAGIDTFTGHVLVDNRAMLAMLRSSGATLAVDEPGVYRFTLPLAQPRAATVAS